MPIVVDIPDADLKAAFFDPLASEGHRQLILSIQILRLTTKQGNAIMATLKELQESAAASIAAQEKTIGVINDLSAKLTDLSKQLQDAIAANDPAALQAVVDSLNAESVKLLAADASATPTA